MVRIRVLDVDGEAADVQGVLAALRAVAIDGGGTGNGQAIPGVLELTAAGPLVAGIRTCVVCGCTDDRACEGGCSWAERYDEEITGDAPPMGLCSQCVGGGGGVKPARTPRAKNGRGGAKNGRKAARKNARPRKVKAAVGTAGTQRRQAHRNGTAPAASASPPPADDIGPPRPPAAPALDLPPGVIAPEEVSLMDDVGVIFQDDAPGGAIAIVIRQGRGRHKHHFQLPTGDGEVGTGKIVEAGCSAQYGARGKPCEERRRFVLT